MINNNEIYKKIGQYIGLSFINQDLLSLLKQQKEFQKIINLFINIVLKTQNPEDSESLRVNESFKNTFIQIVGEFNSDNIINVEDRDELEDNVRYFEVFVQNSLNKSINDIIDQTSKTDEKVIPDLVIDANNDKEKYEEHNQQKQTNKDFNAEEFINNAGTNVNEIAEMMVRQQAVSIVNAKILSGQVFVYNSKPKIIPILKIMISVMFGLLLIFTIVSSGILIYLNGKIKLNISSQGQPRVVDFIFLRFPAMLIFVVLINALLIYSIIRNFKNDNSKYHINWMWPLVYTSILLITLFIESDPSTSLIFGYDRLIVYFQTNSTNWLEYKSLIDSCRYIQFTSMSLIIAILVLLVISIFYNPKRDIERIERLIAEYVHKIKIGEISNDEAGRSFGNRFANDFF